MSRRKKRHRKREKRATKTTGLSPQTADYWVDKYWGSGGGRSSAGVDVNEDTALTASAFFCGVSLIANAVKSMPISILERIDEQNRKEVIDHPAWRLLRVQPNRYVTPSRLKWYLTACKIIWGNGYAEIERTNSGEPINLWPIHPSRVRPGRSATGDIFYSVDSESGQTVIVPAADMLHVIGFSKDGLEGTSVIRFGAEAMGLSIATERSAAAFFGNGAQVPGVLQTPGGMSPEAIKNLREQWTTKMSGQENWHKVAILKEGLEYKSIGIPPEDAQLIESRTFSITDWARWLNLPPHKLKELSHATFSNIEHLKTEYFEDAILPEIIEFEEVCDAKLLTDAERAVMSCKFNDHAILRADIETQTSHFTAMLQNGVYSINMVLGMLNKNGIGKAGDKHMVQGQMIEVGAAAEPPANNGNGPDSDANDDDSDDQFDARTLEPVVRDAFGKIAHKEIDRIRRGMKQHVGNTDEFRAWVHEFYKKHERFVGQTLGPVLSVLGDDRLSGIEARYVGASRRELLVAVQESEAGAEYGAVNSLLEDWTTTRADMACEDLFGSLTNEQN